MENKQTVIEWLLDQMFNKNKLKYERGIQYILPELVEKARAMEKDQIMSAYKSGCVGEMFELNINHSAEQYYEETYGTKKQDSEA